MVWRGTKLQARKMLRRLFQKTKRWWEYRQWWRREVERDSERYSENTVAKPVVNPSDVFSSHCFQLHLACKNSQETLSNASKIDLELQAEQEAKKDVKDGPEVSWQYHAVRGTPGRAASVGWGEVATQRQKGWAPFLPFRGWEDCKALRSCFVDDWIYMSVAQDREFHRREALGGKQWMSSPKECRMWRRGLSSQMLRDECAVNPSMGCLYSSWGNVTTTFLVQCGLYSKILNFPSRLLLQSEVVGACGRQPPYYYLCWVCFSSASIFKFFLKLFHWYFCNLYSKPKFKVLSIRFHLSIQHVNSLASHHVSSSEKGLSKMILYAPKYLRPWPASHHP